MLQNTMVTAFTVSEWLRENQQRGVKFKNEILSVTNSANTTALNPKINEVKNKVFNISNLVTSTTLGAIENKIPNVGYLVKKTDYSRI